MIEYVVRMNQDDSVEAYFTDFDEACEYRDYMNMHMREIGMPECYIIIPRQGDELNKGET